jgi:hypothetical protein
MACVHWGHIPTRITPVTSSPFSKTAKPLADIVRRIEDEANVALERLKAL